MIWSRSFFCLLLKISKILAISYNYVFSVIKVIDSYIKVTGSVCLCLSVPNDLLLLYRSVILTAVLWNEKANKFLFRRIIPRYVYLYSFIFLCNSKSIYQRKGLKYSKLPYNVPKFSCWKHSYSTILFYVFLLLTIRTLILIV